MTAPRSTPARISRRMVLLFAIAGGAAVANLYWAQPLLEEVTSSFGVSDGVAGLLVTTTQVGYAVGVFLLVPLGDVIDRRRLIPLSMLLCAAALALAAVAPTYPILLVSLVMVGLTTVSGPLLTPLAGDLAEPARRGRVIGQVASGLMLGVLASRTVSGLLATAFGWRATYGIAALIALVLTGLLRRAIPAPEPRDQIPYRMLLRSVVSAIRRHPQVRPALLISGISFGVLTMFWTALTLLLARPPFSFSVTTIGLFGLAGIAGALTAQRAGGFHDRGWTAPAVTVALALTLLSFAIAGIGANSVIVLLVAIVLLDIAARALATLSQTSILAVDHTARSRLNTIYVVSTFIGGALGSALATVLWQLGGWTAVMIGGAGLTATAFAAWTLGGLNRPRVRKRAEIR